MLFYSADGHYYSSPEHPEAAGIGRSSGKASTRGCPPARAEIRHCREYSRVAEDKPGDSAKAFKQAEGCERA